MFAGIIPHNGGALIIQIRPVTDLQNNFDEIETVVNSGQSVYLTKNGYGSMVVMSFEKYSELTEDIEQKLDEADEVAYPSDIRCAHEEVFARLKEELHE